MDRTFIIGFNNKFSLKANRWLFLITGLFFLLNGAINIYNRSFEIVGLILGILMLFGGVFYLFYAFVGASKKSRFSPKVKVTDEFIVLKSSFLGKQITLSWSTITKIEFKPLALTFVSNNRSTDFDYVTDADTSIEIKEHLRAMAESKNIEVIGG